MTSNFDEDFDFEDVPTKKKTKPKNKKNTDFDNEFVDFQDDKAVKLPSINNRTANNNHKQSKIPDQFQLEQIKGKSKQKSPMNYELPDEPQEPEIENLQLNQSVEYEPEAKIGIKEDYAASHLQNSNKSIKKEAEEEYGQENFQEENYEEDFQANEEKPPSPVKPKPKEQKIITGKPANIPKPKSKEIKRGTGSVSKKVEPPVRGNSRINSRNSARSNSRNSANSKTRPEEKKQQISGPNKYINFTEKHCPSYDEKTLEDFSLDKLTRQNERVRNTIKKLNDELNDLINKNIMQLKGKKNEKQVNQDDIIKQLQELKSSNQTALQTSIKDLAKLKTKEGALKQEEYHLTLDQNIIDTRNSITQCGKILTKLKYEVDNEGKKLTKIDKADKEHPTVEISNIKVSSINAQKQYEKNEEHLKKLESKLQSLNKKITEAQGKHNQQIDEAKRKGVSLIVNPELHKKAQQLKKRIQIAKQHKSKTQSLFKSKGQVIGHENDQIRAQIKQIQNSTLTCHASCEEMQNQSKKTVEKAKRGGKFAPEILSTLEILINQMENGILYHKQSGSEDRILMTHPKGAKKYQSQKNMQKVVTPQKEMEKTHQDDSNLKKPVLFKKKKDDEEKSYRTEKVEKQQERVWKEEASTVPVKSPNRGSVSDLATFQNKQEVREEKKKPFMIKKNKDKTIDELKESPKPQKKQPVEQPKNEETPSIAPRMIKFKRNKEQPAKQQTSKPIVINDKNTAPVINNETKQDDDKPAFVPRRFNMKLKDKKSEDTGYIASTVQKKQEVKQEIKEQIKPTGLYLEKEEATSKPTQEEQIKPTRFNLKLRDRQKENNPEPKSQYEPKVQPPATKIAINLNDEPKPSKQNNNPYANPYAQAYEGRKKQKKQGPIKEAKPVIVASKQKYDLFNQAEDLDNIAQIKADSPKPSYAPSKPQNEDLDLNSLLGKPKVAKKQVIDEDLLVDDTLFGKK